MNYDKQEDHTPKESLRPYSPLFKQLAVEWSETEGVSNVAAALGISTTIGQSLTTVPESLLYSPVDGVVQEMKINTIGGVVLEAQDLMTIVPSNEVLEVQAFIDNKDVGFIAPGMPAEIKVQTFPFTQYGVINATVKTVTDDALANQEKGLFFAMQLVMEKNTILVNGKAIALRPGMQVTAEVKTGKWRSIEYFLTPVIKGFK